MVDPALAEAPEFFQGQVRPGKLEEWRDAGTRHPVFLSELLPIAIAAGTWEHKLKDRKALIFLDNGAARLAMVKGYSPLRCAAEIIGGAWSKLAAAHAYVWFARVASEANPADGPSRLRGFVGGRQVAPKVAAKLGQVEVWLV